LVVLNLEISTLIFSPKDHVAHGFTHLDFRKELLELVSEKLIYPILLKNILTDDFLWAK